MSESHEPEGAVPPDQPARGPGEPPPPPGFGPPPGPPGDAPPPPGYGQPPGYAQPPGYGQPPGYAQPPGYGPPPGPGTQPPGYPPPGSGPWEGPYPAPAPPPGWWFDPESGLTLPNGVTLAGHGRRIAAFFLAIPLSIVTLFIGYLIWGLIIWGRGQTPTQQVLGMRTWRPSEGRPANWGYMALREIVGRFVEGFLSLITELISLIFFLVRSDRQCLHDMISGTVVVYDPGKVLG